MENIDRCISCGTYVPEGSMVCWDCANPIAINDTVSYIDPVLFTLWNWKVYYEDKSGFYATKNGETVRLEGNSLDGLVELIILREKKYNINDKN